MTYFIEAAEKIIRKEGINSLSIRKIALEAGYNSATIYNYFEDLDHLVLFASMKELKEYILGLAKEINDSMTSYEKYHTVYRIFSKYSFNSPEIFYNMFFGKHSDKLVDVLKKYYELFPDELAEHSGPVKEMLSQGDIYQRDLKMMNVLVKDGYVKEENKDLVLNIIVRTHQSFIYEAYMHQNTIDIEDHCRKYMKIFEYVMSMAR